jgi:deazaflavin-dependent oxidoreductase (nitroreductase family)
MTVAASKPRLWHNLIRRLSATRWGSRLIAGHLHAWDSTVLRLTHGRTTATTALTGLPVIMLRTKGARSGQARITPLLAIGDSQCYLLIATNFGSGRHPDWYYNLKASPVVEVLQAQNARRYIARELDGDERQAGWERAVDHFAGYASYQIRAGSRRIPVFALTPLTNETGAHP